MDCSTLSNEQPLKRKYLKLESAFLEASRKYMISCNKSHISTTKLVVESIIQKIVASMKKQSTVFKKMYVRKFNGGSIYEGTKVGNPDEFDIDILLKLPEVITPVVVQKNIAGFTQLWLKNFDTVKLSYPEMSGVFDKFVDNDNYVLSKDMSLYFWNVLENALFNFLPNLQIHFNTNTYKITKIEYIEPAITLTVDGPNFHVNIDLVVCFLFEGNFWPREDCRVNPYKEPKEFFLTPQRPNDFHSHRDRFWRLSFHMQERKILFNRQKMKPAFRAIKRIRDHFGHSVRSYALKTIFLWKLHDENSSLDSRTSDFWKAPLSYIVVYMLEKYFCCLADRNIPDFWNPKLNLLCYLTDEETEQYKQNIALMLDDINQNLQPGTLLKYLE